MFIKIFLIFFIILVNISTIADDKRLLMASTTSTYDSGLLDYINKKFENKYNIKVHVLALGTGQAIKLAKKYGKKNKGGAYEIITALNSFHGRTMMNVSATGQPHYQELFTPIPTGFSHVPFNDLDAVKQSTGDNTIAVMIEPVQGEGGVNVPSIEYLRGVR